MSTQDGLPVCIHGREAWARCIDCEEAPAKPEVIELPRRYALGALAGHADGQLRELKSFSVREKYWYLKGYEYGYVRRASGETLPEWCAS